MDADFAARVNVTADAVPTAERQAALALHSMQPADRSWMLERLPAAGRKQLQGLLDELNALGVPAQPQWMLERCLGGPAGEVRGNAVPEPTDERQRLRSLSAQQAHRLLAGEPDRLIADVLQLGPFPWQASLLDLLPARRAGIEAMLDRLPAAAGSRRKQVLLRGLTARAAQLSAEPGPQVAPAAVLDRRHGWMASLLRRMWRR